MGDRGGLRRDRDIGGTSSQVLTWATPWMTRSRQLERVRVGLLAAKLSMYVCSPSGARGADRRDSISVAACSVRSFQWTRLKPAVSMKERNPSAEARWLSSGWSAYGSG